MGKKKTFFFRASLDSILFVRMNNSFRDINTFIIEFDVAAYR